MKNIFKAILSGIARFFTSPVKLSLFLITILMVLALSEFMYLGLARRTFVFYTISDGELIIEERMLKLARSQEENIIQYVSEAVLGPLSPDLLPLIPGGTRLLSLFFRDGVVYLNLSENAALPPLEGGSTRNNFMTLYAGIRRNFSYISDVHFFIEGNAVYTDEFQQEFMQNIEFFTDL